MEQHRDLNTMLQLLTQPAFLVEHGRIGKVNAAAAAILLREGEDFASLLATGSAEYADFTDGDLFVTLRLSGISRDGWITRMGNVDLVRLEACQSQEKLQVLSLAAQVLRGPMTGLMHAAEQLLPAATEENALLERPAAQMNQRIYQMLRVLDNMSDAESFALPGRMETIEVCDFFAEILEKAASLKPQLRYELPREPIYTLADPVKLERAVLNQLSNALKYAAEGTEVAFRLTKKNHRIYICVSNIPSNPEDWKDPFDRFLRSPGLEDPRNGVGLGMLLMQNTAALHGGAVLMDRVGEVLRFTLSLPIQRGEGQVRSPIRLFDQDGGQDRCLVELSDVLPAKAYTPKNLL